MTLATVVLLAQAAAQPGIPWQRQVSTPKFLRFDTPQAHPLAYFTKYPRLRQEDGDFCWDCSPEQRLAAAKAEHVKTELSLIGTIAGFSAFDLFCRFECEGCPAWKSILIKTGPDRYREIYHREPTTPQPDNWRSVIVDIAGVKLLGTRDFDGGNKGGYYDSYYWFGKSGPVLVDFNVVREAAAAEVPPGKALWGGGEENTPATLATGRFRFWLMNTDSSLCCARGAIEVRFRLDGGRVIVTGTRHDPDGGPM